MQKIMIFFFAFLIVFALLILAIWNSTTLENATGLTDATFQTLQRSGETQASQSPMRYFSYLFGLGILGIFGFALTIGVQKRQTVIQNKHRNIIIAGILLIMTVYSGMVFSWWDYVETNNMNYILGVPRPTAWMLFGITGMSLFITIFYILKFNDWVITPKEMEEFQELVRKRREREGLELKN